MERNVFLWGLGFLWLGAVPVCVILSRAERVVQPLATPFYMEIYVYDAAGVAPTHQDQKSWGRSWKIERSTFFWAYIRK